MHLIIYKIECIFLCCQTFYDIYIMNTGRVCVVFTQISVIKITELVIDLYYKK